MDIPDGPDLLRQHRGLTARLTRRVGRSEAEDLASEAVARGLRRPAPDGHQGPWIERIFRNLAVDAHRRCRWTQTRVSLLPEPPAVATPESLCLEGERQAALRSALPKIPLPLRDALWARFYEGRDYEALAATRGISPATARTRVHRGLARLRVMLHRLGALVPTPMWGVHSFSASLLPAVLTFAVTFPSPPVADEVRGSARPLFSAQARRSSSKVAARPGAAKTVAPERSSAPAAKPPTKAAARPASARSATTPPDDSAAVKRLEFENDDIEVDQETPGIELVRGAAPPLHHGSLIDVPLSFVPAIVKMLEDL